MNAHSLLVLTASVVPLLASCGDCGACAPSLTLEVSLANGDGPVMVDDARVTCSSVAEGLWQCGANGLEEGDYTLALTAPGHEERTLSFTIGPPSGGGLYCSPCPGRHYERVQLVATGVPPLDGGAGDGG